MPLAKDLAIYPPEVFELTGLPVKAIFLSDQVCQSALGSVTTILSGDSEGKAEVDVRVNGLCNTVTLWPCQDRFSSTILLGGPGMQGTNEEVSPDTSRCWLVWTIKSRSYG